MRAGREVVGRARRLAGALDAADVPRQARVATFAWNSQRHVELYLAVPSSGRVLHTVNHRLFARRDHPHRQRRRGRHRVRRPVAPAHGLAAGAGVPHGPARRGDGRRRRRAAARRRPRRRLRAVPRECDRAGGTGLGRRARRREPLLHLRHHGPTQGRALQPSLDRAARPAPARRRRLRDRRARRRDADRADVPRQRLGSAVRRDARRRRPGPPRTADGAGPAGRPDVPAPGDLHGGCAGDLAGAGAAPRGPRPRVRCGWW